MITIPEAVVTFPFNRCITPFIVMLDEAERLNPAALFKSSRLNEVVPVKDCRDVPAKLTSPDPENVPALFQFPFTVNVPLGLRVSEAPELRVMSWQIAPGVFMEG